MRKKLIVGNWHIQHKTNLEFFSLRWQKDITFCRAVFFSNSEEVKKYA